MLSAVQLLQYCQGNYVFTQAGKKSRPNHPFTTVHWSEPVGRRKSAFRESRFSKRALCKSCAMSTSVRAVLPMGIRSFMIQRAT